MNTSTYSVLLHVCGRWVVNVSIEPKGALLPLETCLGHLAIECILLQKLKYVKNWSKLEKISEASQSRHKPKNTFMGANILLYVQKELGIVVSVDMVLGTDMWEHFCCQLYMVSWLKGHSAYYFPGAEV